MKNYRHIVVILIIAIFISSCSSMNGSINSSLNSTNEETYLLENEENVKSFLETILQVPFEYTISAYERNLKIRLNQKRTKLATHSFYLFTNINNGDIYTVGYTAKKFARYATGTWELNNENDLSSYYSFLRREKKWDTAKIEIDIDVIKTVNNILDILGNSRAYYYRSHLNPKPGFYNCNSALWSTLVITEHNTQEL